MAHVSTCLHCTRTIAQAGVDSMHWERRGWLGRLVRVDGPAVEVQPAEAPASPAGVVPA